MKNFGTKNIFFDKNTQFLIKNRWFFWNSLKTREFGVSCYNTEQKFSTRRPAQKHGIRVITREMATLTERQIHKEPGCRVVRVWASQNHCCAHQQFWWICKQKIGKTKVNLRPFKLIYSSKILANQLFSSFLWNKSDLSFLISWSWIHPGWNPMLDTPKISPIAPQKIGCCDSPEHSISHFLVSNES